MNWLKKENVDFTSNALQNMIVAVTGHDNADVMQPRWYTTAAIIDNELVELISNDAGETVLMGHQKGLSQFHDYVTHIAFLTDPDDNLPVYIDDVTVHRTTWK